MDDHALAGAAARYAAYFETLRPDTVARLAEVAAPEIRFRDPFNDVRGRDRMEAVLQRMFAELPDSTFTITGSALVRGGVYLRWRYRGGRWRIEGMSEVAFDASGLAVEHIDHWDAAGQVYERLPVIGWILAAIRARLGTRG